MKRLLAYAIPALFVAAAAFAGGPYPGTIPLFSSSHRGLVPASGGGTANFLRADGTFSQPPSLISTIFFGSGGDGACHFDGSTAVLGSTPSGGVYDLARNIFCSSVTIDSGVTVDPDGWVIHDSGAMVNNGKIAYLANAGAEGAGNSGGAAGASRPTSGARWMFGSVFGGGCCGGGGVGGDGASSSGSPRPCAAVAAVVPGGTPAICQGGPGGTGSTAGGNGGAVVLVSGGDAHNASLYDIFVAMSMRTQDGTALVGGSAGGSGVNGSGAGCGGAGGGGASGGPVVVLAYGPITGTGTIEAKGGAGGAGQQSGCTGCATGPNVCTATGAGGGAGGFIVEIIGTGSFPSSSVAGGAGGAASPLGAAPGTAGGSGVLIQVRAAQ